MFPMAIIDKAGDLLAFLFTLLFGQIHIRAIRLLINFVFSAN